MMRNWAQTPKPITLGSFQTRTKSSVFKVMPIPSMMIPNPTPIDSFPNHKKHSGLTKARTPTKTDQSGKRFVPIRMQRVSMGNKSPSRRLNGKKNSKGLYFKLGQMEDKHFRFVFARFQPKP